VARAPDAGASEGHEAAVARSDTLTNTVLDLVGRFDPESTSESGYEAFDADVVDLAPDRGARWRREAAIVSAALQERLRGERNPEVAVDLELLVSFLRAQGERERLEDETVVPLVDVASRIHSGISSLLSARGDARRARAIPRLRRYVGAPTGASSVVLAEERTRRALASPGRIAPSRAEIEKLIRLTPMMLDATRALLEGARVESHEALVAVLRAELEGYVRFLRDEVLPRARREPRLPEARYRLLLEEAGIDADPRELAARAHAEMERTQGEMQALAATIARDHRFPQTDYRAVIRALKAESPAEAPGPALTARYERRGAEIEAIVRREHLVTLPARAVNVRIASEAESARMPAPFYEPPPLTGNTGEVGVFVLPTSGAAGTKATLDDFGYDPASWWLSAHEARPGHDLQFSRMIEGRVSLARAIFAQNSANAEGWGLYAEEMIRPYMPKEAALFCLQARLMRCAHAFLDIEVNLGLTRPEEVMRVMTEDVVFSEAWATQALNRYTFVMPGQAPSYLYGYLGLVAIRDEVRRARGAAVTPQAFHDFVLAQGMLPPRLLRRVVLAHFEVGPPAQ